MGAVIFLTSYHASPGLCGTTATQVMQNKGAHMVLWLNRPFVTGTELRFGFRPANTSQGLAIVFFDTMPIQNKSK